MRNSTAPLATLALGAIALLAVACSSDDKLGTAEGQRAGPAVATAAADAETQAAAAVSEPQLVDLEGLDDLRARFNEAEGKPRILLLLSPT